MEIALKKCYETEYWLEVLFGVKAINEETYIYLNNKCVTIRRKLIASVTTAKKQFKIKLYKGIIMNKSIEENFVNNYIVNNKRERLLFELGSKNAEIVLADFLTVQILFSLKRKLN